MIRSNKTNKAGQSGKTFGDGVQIKERAVRSKGGLHWDDLQRVLCRVIGRESRTTLFFQQVITGHFENMFKTKTFLCKII